MNQYLGVLYLDENGQQASEIHQDICRGICMKGILCGIKFCAEENGQHFCVCSNRMVFANVIDKYLSFGKLYILSPIQCNNLNF